MPLSPEQQAELAELRRLDQLEAKFGGSGIQAKSAPETSNLDAAGAGSAQALSLGYTPQIVGGIASLLGGKTKLATGEEIENTPYTQARDATDQSINKARKEHPGAYYGANITGNVASGVGLAKALPKVAGIGATALQGAKVGGALGLAQNPGETPGELSPLQARDRALGGLLGASTGGLMGGAGGALGRAGGLKNDINMVKSGGVSKEAKSQIDASLAQLNQRQIQPRSNSIDELMQGQSFEVNPDLMSAVTPKYAMKLKQRAQPSEGFRPNPNPSGPPVPQGPFRAEMSGPRVRSNRQRFDQMANYGKSKPYSEAAQAKGAEAKAAADMLRRHENSVPGVQKLKGEQADILSLRDALASKAESNPVSSLGGEMGSDQANLVQNIDQLAGSDLRGLGSRIKTAQSLQLEPQRLVNVFQPLKMGGEIAKTAARGGIEAGAALNKAIPAGTKEAALNQAFEAKRKKVRKK